MINYGQTVTLNYTGRTKEGEVFDTTEGRDPHSFVLGTDRLITGIERALVGRQIGDTFTIEIPMADAYGEYSETKVQKIPKGYMPGEVYEDQILVARGTNGEDAKIIVKEVLEDHVVVDGNHPLAGMDLVFDIEIVDAI